MLALCQRDEVETIYAWVTLLGFGLVATLLLGMSSVIVWFYDRPTWPVIVTPVTALVFMILLIFVSMPIVVSLEGVRIGMVSSGLFLEPFLPLLLQVQLFELAAKVHQERGVNFCGYVYFEETSKTITNGRLLVARGVVYLISFSTFALAMAGNLQLIVEVGQNDRANERWVLCFLATFGEWIYGNNTFGSTVLRPGNEILFIVADVIQPLVLAGFGMFFGYVLWRYGSFYSFSISSSDVNPWLTLLVASVVLIIGLFVASQGVLQTISFTLMVAVLVVLCKLSSDETSLHDDMESYLASARVPKGVTDLNAIRKWQRNNAADQAVLIESVKSLPPGVKLMDILAAPSITAGSDAPTLPDAESGRGAKLLAGRKTSSSARSIRRIESFDTANGSKLPSSKSSDEGEHDDVIDDDATVAGDSEDTDLDSEEEEALRKIVCEVANV
mmetsp:Transcript_7560/g.13188  ORF Transcript_7560/g.13188 Transcript_7560/m.13188 type:complete len:444 (-) Transcript_7560:69-1400(-)